MYNKTYKIFQPNNKPYNPVKGGGNYGWILVSNKRVNCCAFKSLEAIYAQPANLKE